MKTTMVLMLALAGLAGCATEDAGSETIAPEGGKADGAACAVDRTKLETAARGLMTEHGLIRAGEETVGDFAARWGLESVEMHGDTCLAVMTPCYFSGGESLGCEAAMIEVVTYEPTSDGDVTVALFEDTFPVASTLRVGIGNVGPDYHPDGTPFPELSDDLYYVELSGASVTMAMKSVIAAQHYCGFTGLVIPGGAAAFDPTPDRTWRVVDGKFDLRRGNSHEVGDIRPAHWDGAFDDYYSGAVRRPVVVDGTTVEGAEVLPWGACFMRRYQDDAGRWIDVIDKPIR